MCRKWLFGTVGVLLLLAIGLVVLSRTTMVGWLVYRSLFWNPPYITDTGGRLLTDLPRKLDQHHNPRDESQDIVVLDDTLNFLIHVYESEGLDAAARFVPIAGAEHGTVKVVLYQEPHQTDPYRTAEIAESLRELGIEPHPLPVGYLSAFVPISMLREIAVIEHLQEAYAPYPVILDL